MPVRALRVRDFRSFEDSGVVQLGPVNILLGPNNAGKSTLLRALGLLQEPLPASPQDIRLGRDTATVEVGFGDLPYPFELWLGTVHLGDPNGTVHANLSRASGLQLSLAYTQTSGTEGAQGLSRLPAAEPYHYIVPYLSRRKTADYLETVNLGATTAIQPDLRHLVAKLARLSNPDFPASALYRRACKEIFGFVVTAIPSESGQQPGVYVSNTETIPLADMGEGVPNVVGLLADLAVADRKLFLIEEPENDIHPRALKAVLDLIAKSAAEGRNQFIVSTHSNVVARHLGALPDSRLLHVDAQRENLPPIAACREVGTDPRERIRVLRDLGYELYDFDLWDGWLILEEASAERLIRDHLVPWFAPELKRVRTVSVGGNAQIEPAFADFHRLFLFTHLEAQYRNRAWVLIDGDSKGHEIVRGLRETYGPAWDPSHFRALDETAFERYYPSLFSDGAEAALAIQDKQARRTAKSALLNEVLAWIEQDTARAKEEFATSAAEVVRVLREVEQALFG